MVHRFSQLSPRNKILIPFVILIVVIFVFVFVYVSTNSQPKDVISDKTPAKPLGSTTPIETKNNAKVSNLEIRNWNIELKPTDDLKETEIKYTEKAHDVDQSSYGFTTARVESLGGKCKEGELSSIVILTRFTEKPIAVPDGELVNSEPIKGYYYVVSSPIAPCSGYDKNGNLGPMTETEARDRLALKQTLKSISDK